MNNNDRQTLRCIAQLLEYPDHAFFERIPEYRVRIEKEARGFANPALHLFLDDLEELGPQAAQEAYVAAFDHNPASSLNLTWHRYGNDRKQGRAMASLNELYRDAGFEPVPGVLPDYVPRVFEFLSVCEEWAAEALLDGFGPELAKIGLQLESTEHVYALLFSLAVDILSREYPPLFRPRKTLQGTTFEAACSKDASCESEEHTHQESMPEGARETLARRAAV